MRIVGDKLDTEVYNEIRQAILDLEIMPSMRAMMTAGAAADREHMDIKQKAATDTEQSEFSKICNTDTQHTWESNKAISNT